MRRSFFGVLALAVCVMATVSADTPRKINAKFKDQLIRRIDKRLGSHAFASGVEFSHWRNHVERHRSALDAADNEEALRSALNGALAEFGVSHLWVWSPRQMRTREAGLQGGLGLKSVSLGSGRLVTMVILGGPADRAGVQRGDVITAINGKPASRSLMGRGTAGEERKLTLQRKDTQTDVVVVLSQHPRANPATLGWLENDIALISVPSFSRSFYEKRPLYLEDLIEWYFDDAVDAAGIIIDVRSNGGGYYLFPEHLAAMFMSHESRTYYVLHAEERQKFLDAGGSPEASLLEMAMSSGQAIRPTAIKGREPYSGPVAVLMDRRSGSAGETFPATVKAAGRGVLIGTRSAGTVLAGDNYKLPGGFVLFYPQAESVMPDGTRLEGNGVVPDIELTPPQTTDDDFIFQVATKELLRRAAQP